MNIGDWSKKTHRLLEETAAAATAKLDSLVLLEDIIKKDRAWILAHPEFELDVNSLHKLDSMIERRAKHEPLAYIRGKSEFYGREFMVSSATLQPRPETETMIDLLKKLDLPARPTIADIGTGSGAIAITAKLEIPQALVFATDIQPETLKIAQKNAQKLHTEVSFLQGNLLEPLYTLQVITSTLLCNLPYVPDSHTINQAAMQEPKIAIFGGGDGLDLYRQMFAQIDMRQKKTKYILTESLPFQHDTLIYIAKKSGYVEVEREDFILVFCLVEI
jgi:release factor glutamine methyltransferase